MLAILALMHGIFEAGVSVSVLKSMHMPSDRSILLEQTSAQCCEDEAIEISTVAFHCPLDGKILGCGIEISPRTGKQVYAENRIFQLTSITGSTFFKPPIS